MVGGDIVVGISAALALSRLLKRVGWSGVLVVMACWSFAV